VLDGIKFKGIEDIAKDPTFKKITSLKELNDQVSLNLIIKDLQSNRPEF
jgi:hypothetical protein